VEWLEATQHAHLGVSQLSEAEREAMTEPGRVEALERRCEVQLQQLGDLQDRHHRLASSVRMLEREVVRDQPEPSPVATDEKLRQLYHSPETTFVGALRAIYDLGRQHGGQPAPATEESSAPAPAGSLVEQMLDAMDQHLESSRYAEARAALRVVAAWLRGESDGHLGSGAHWARCMEQEADR
jgi:hypothetical protein